MKKFLKITLSLLLTVGLVTFLIKQIGVNELFNLFSQFSYPYAIVGFICYISSYFLRCWRWRFFFPDGDINLLDLFSLTSLTIVSQNILPGGSGEVSFVLILKKVFNISYSRGIISMLVARLFDLLTMMLVFMGALILLLQQKNIEAVWLGVIVVVICGLAVMILFMDRIARLFIRFMGKYHERYPKLGPWLEKMEVFEANIIQLHKRRVYLNIFLVSFANQGVRFVAFQKMVEAVLNRPFSLLSTIYGSTFSEISSKIPIHGVLGLGTFEGSWVGAQMLMGMSKAEAVLTAFALHAVLLLFSAVMGGLGLAIILLRKKTQARESG